MRLLFLLRQEKTTHGRCNFYFTLIFDLNNPHYFNPPFVYACSHGSVEVVKMMINLSKEFGISLNVRNCLVKTALDEVTRGSDLYIPEGENSMKN